MTAKSYRMEDGRWSHQMRTTFFTDFAMCPEKAAATYFEEIEEDDQETDGTARGTAVHAGIEHALIAKRDSHVPAREEVIEVVHQKLDELWPWQIKKAQPKTTRRHAYLMINTWYDEVLPLCEPLHMERKFKLQIVGDDYRNIWLTGGIDFEDTSFVCWDWKTAARPYEAWEYQRWASQPSSYAFAAWVLRQDPELIDKWGWNLDEMEDQWFRYAILLENGGLQILDVVRNGGHVKWLTEQALQIATMIEAEQRPWPLIDKGWHCSPKWCPIFDRCKGTHMSDDWMEVRR